MTRHTLSVIAVVALFTLCGLLGVLGAALCKVASDADEAMGYDDLDEDDPQL